MKKFLGGTLLLVLFLLTACGENQITELYGVQMSQETAEIINSTQELNSDIVEQLSLIEQEEAANTDLMFENIHTASQSFIDHLGKISREVKDEKEISRLENHTNNIQNLADGIIKYQENGSDIAYEDGLTYRYYYVSIIENYLSGTINDSANEEKLLAELTSELNVLFGTEEIITNGEHALKMLEENLGDIFQIEFSYDGLRKNFIFTPTDPYLVEYITSMAHGEVGDYSYWEEHVDILTLLSEELTEIVGSNCYIWYKNPSDAEEILVSIVDGYIFVEM